MATSLQEHIQCQETSTENNENKCHRKKGPIFCEPCQYDESFEEATGFCVTCSEYLCQTCCRDHKRNKVTRIHSLLKNDDIPADITPFTTIKKLSTCKIHPNIDIAYECEDHEALVCVFCFTESHRKCENVHDLGDVVSADWYVNAIAALQERIHLLIAKKYEQQKTIEVEQQKVKINIQCLVTEWKDHITGLGNDIETQLSKMSLTQTTQIIESIDRCKAVENEIERNKTLIETLIKYGTKRQIAVVFRRTNHAHVNLKDQLQILECQRQRNFSLMNVNKLDMLTSIADLHLEDEGKDSIDILEHASDEMDDTLYSEDKKMERILQTSFDVSNPVGKQRSSKPFSDRESGQKITLFKIKTETDTNTCGICAVKLTEYGVLVADHRNQKLKLFSRQFDLICEHSLPGQPVDMCFDGTSAYVCYSDLKKVTKHKVTENAILNELEFPTRLQPISLTVFDSRLMILFVTKENFDSTAADNVHIEIRRGSSIDATMSYNSDDESFNYVEDAKQISVFGESSVVFSENWQVSCYTVDIQAGKLTDRQWFYKLHDNSILKKAKGVAKDSEGNIYICGENSNNVHQASSTNHRLNRVIIPRCDRPVCIAVDEQKDRLIIGCRIGDYLQAYSFK
ncbi:uncharacterized protein LOC128235704 [Mya arenaria]|uniref:uncharacterized protein LOC128235704 n=1 Tax=Mya arenaria TaxID=6604 RepID=UPI0022E1EEA4|nr:uncharacterized protein LOC128235704 [Mya arenaria]